MTSPGADCRNYRNKGHVGGKRRFFADTAGMAFFVRRGANGMNENVSVPALEFRRFREYNADGRKGRKGRKGGKGSKCRKHRGGQEDKKWRMV